jgi:hypothetical protein
LCCQLHMTPYQSYIIQNNWLRYDLTRLVKVGSVLYAPYRCNRISSFCDCIKRIFLGRRADLIGEDRIIVIGKRGIKVYNDGKFTEHKNCTHCTIKAEENNSFIRII